MTNIYKPLLVILNFCYLGIVTTDPEIPVDKTLIPSPPVRPKNPIFENEEKSKVCESQMCTAGGRMGACEMVEIADSRPVFAVACGASEEQEPRGPAGGQPTHQEHGEGGETLALRHMAPSG